VFPALAPAPPEGAGADEAPDLAGAAEVRRQQLLLAGLTQQAKERMDRPFFAPATEEAHRVLAEGQTIAPRHRAPAGRGRGLAMAVGSAIHRLLEAADLKAGPAGRADELARALAGLVPAAGFDEAVARVAALLRRFAASPLAARLAAAAPHVLGREVPVLLPPVAEGEGPVGYVAGVIDLLLRDPATGEIVVVDYKTDEVEAGEELERRATAYSLQGRVYARAMQEALGLPSPPRVELWFLWPGLVKEVTS
jgi:ATP-dependent exoDNAse (exonuclease V) beta subunit